MKIGFVVNDIDTEKPRVHHQPARHGRQGDGPRGVVHGHRRLRLRARRLAERQGPDRVTRRTTARSSDTSVDVKKPDVEQLIGLDEFDVVMLRNDPADDAEIDAVGATTPESPSAS